MIKPKLLATAFLALLGTVLAPGSALASASFSTLIDTPSELKVQWSGTLADFNSASVLDPNYWDILGFQLLTQTETFLGTTISTWQAGVIARHDSVTPAHPHAGDTPLGPQYFTYLSGDFGSTASSTKTLIHDSVGHKDIYTFSVTSDNLGNGTASLSAVHAVPEPESYAMLLAGLGILGTIVRRRKRIDA